MRTLLRSSRLDREFARAKAFAARPAAPPRGACARAGDLVEPLHAWVAAGGGIKDRVCKNVGLVAEQRKASISQHNHGCG